MENHPLLQPLDDILAAAHQLLQLAEAGDWEALDTGAQQFQQQVAILNDAAYIQSLMDEQLVEQAKEMIAQIQTLNTILDSRASEMREQVSSELRQIIQSDKALSAYSR